MKPRKKKNARQSGKEALNSVVATIAPWLSLCARDKTKRGRTWRNKRKRSRPKSSMETEKDCSAAFAWPRASDLYMSRKQGLFTLAYADFTLLFV
jgi:hypothetical protein